MQRGKLFENFLLYLALVLHLFLFGSSYSDTSKLSSSNRELVASFNRLENSGQSLVSPSSGQYRVSSAATPNLNFMLGFREDESKTKLSTYWVAELKKNFSNYSTGSLLYGSASGYKNLVGLRYLTQVFYYPSENIGLKANMSFSYYDFENTGAFASVGNLLYGKQINSFLLFSGVQFPITHWMTRSGYRLQGDMLGTYAYLGAEYLVTSYLGLYTDYYKNKFSVGISVCNMPIVLAFGSNLELRIGHPFLIL